MLIPHSKALIERIFSSIQLTKTCVRNRLAIPVVDDLMVVKYHYDDSFEPEDFHYDLYRMRIKSE